MSQPVCVTASLTLGSPLPPLGGGGESPRAVRVNRLRHKTWDKEKTIEQNKPLIEINQITPRKVSDPNGETLDGLNIGEHSWN